MRLKAEGETSGLSIYWTILRLWLADDEADDRKKYRRFASCGGKAIAVY